MTTLKIYSFIFIYIIICCIFIACTNEESKIYGEWATISKETRIYFKNDHTGVVDLFTNITSNNKPNSVVNFKWLLQKDGTFKLVDTHNNIMVFKLNGNKIETDYNGKILDYSKVDENTK
ncbi:MAG: hypothetical protein ABSA86_12540 [Oryzomonas sp.]